jgi:bifunctional DNA-binding transcriptional regulator/antitoxin component of YhaV-PrlF toxin-antitoxin module
VRLNVAGRRSVVALRAAPTATTAARATTSNFVALSTRTVVTVRPTPSGGIHDGRILIVRRHRITAGGQVSLPAAVRRRWGTKTVAIEDLGDRVVLRPLPDDPIAAARGALKGRLPSTAELRKKARKDEADAEARR